VTSFVLDEMRDHPAIFMKPRLMDVEQRGRSSGFTTRVNMLAPFFG
jgi:hypothetical protein